MSDEGPALTGLGVPTMVENMVAAISAAYAPAVDARAPYAKFMAEKAAKDALEAARLFGNVPTEVASLAIETAKHDKTGEVLVFHVWTGMIDAALSKQA